MADNVTEFKRTAMKVEFTIFVKPGVTEAQVRAFVDQAVHHAWGSVMSEQIGDFVFRQPTVRTL